VLRQASRKIGHVKRPYAKVNDVAPRAPIPAASVGVAIPKMMLGGIKIPRQPPAVMTPEDNFES
jgi:hypothetical protein